MLTPFAALTAYKNGFSPADGVWDIPSAKPELVPVAYLQSGQTESGPIRLRSAITEDRLAPIVELTREIGSDKVLKTLSEFGLSNWSGLNAERLYFNGGYVSVEGLAFAYSAFAGGGQLSGTISSSLKSGWAMACAGVKLFLGSSTGNILVDNEKTIERLNRSGGGVGRERWTAPLSGNVYH